MATKIRLQRHGRKGYAFYAIVVAHDKAPRDGRFIEKIGTYNPNTDPSTVDLNFDRAYYWVGVGAQPTDTVRNILSREGVYLKKHLAGGVKKGAFDDKLTKKMQENKAEAKKAYEARQAEEKKVNEAIAQKVAEKKAAAAKAKAEAEAAANAEAAAETTEAPAEA